MALIFAGVLALPSPSTDVSRTGQTERAAVQQGAAVVSAGSRIVIAKTSLAAQAGFTYVQGQTYFTQQFASDPGKWRVAMGTAGLDATDLPYPWGLGGDLAPGASTTVTGHIKVTQDFKASQFLGSGGERAEYRRPNRHRHSTHYLAATEPGHRGRRCAEPHARNDR
jgi:hypothetical protein